MDITRLQQLLERIRQVRLLVFGDYFLDDYLILDRKLSEVSVETQLEAYQVSQTRKYPGASGTVAANARALGANVLALGVTGEDGNGYELRKGLAALGVEMQGLLTSARLATPTYMKPMLREVDGWEHELNRMDVKNRQPLPSEVEEQIIEQLRALWQEADGVLVLDQVTERNCGVITDNVRVEIARLAQADPRKPVLADSRAMLKFFKGVMLKCNLREALEAANLTVVGGESAESCARRCGQVLIERNQKPVLITLGECGILLLTEPGAEAMLIPAIPVSGQIDIVGAGDSVSASVGAALCAGANLPEACALGCLVASIVIKQIGVTGTASPQQVIAQFLRS